MANVKIRHLSKNAAWHTASATWIPELGRIVILTGANPLLFKIGDGTTQLQNLDWSNGTKTLAQTLLQGNKVNELTVESNNGASVLRLKNAFTQLSFDNGSVAGYLYMDDSEMDISHDIAINLTAPSVTIAGYPIATQSFVDQRIQSNIKIIGDWDATSGSFPLADESNTTPFIAQWGATIKQGWAFRVGYNQAGTVDGYDYENGDVVYALVDNPTDDSDDWGDLDHNLQQANESTRGTAKIVTISIIEDETTLDDEKIVTPYKFWSKAIPKFKLLANTWDLLQTFTNGIKTSILESSVGEFLFTRSGSSRILIYTNGKELHLSSQLGGNPTLIFKTDGTMKAENGTVSSILETDGSNIIIFASKNSAYNKNFGTTAGSVCEGNDSRLSNSRDVKYAAYDNTDTTHTGNTTETFMKGLLVPSLDANSSIDVFALLNKTGTAGNIVWNLYYNTTNDLIGSPVKISTTTQTSSQLYGGKFIRTIINKNSLTNNYIFRNTVAAVNDFSANASAMTSIGVDLSGKYLIITATLANSGDTANLSAFQLIHTKP